MNYYLACLLVFAVAYVINITYITVFYHRGLTHGAVQLGPRTRRFVIATGSWVTGIDPKGWSCMHRLHHQYSDTERDPHSPVHFGIFGVMTAQLRSYNRILSKLSRGDEDMARVAGDLDFPVHWLNRKGLWLLPYVLHLATALLIAWGLDAWLMGGAYFAGMMSHPVQGWMVNSFAHSIGYRNYATSDDSRNNTVVALLVMGEGYQNNHHRFPKSPRFSVRWFEVDLGYGLCLGLEALGLITMDAAAVGKDESLDSIA